MDVPKQQQQQQQPRSAKKKALLIGINYVGQPAELAGCVNDVIDMRAVCAALKYDEVCVLYDGVWTGAFDPADDRLGGTKPTRANITAAFRWLVAGAGRGDHLLLHYSGHGGQLPALIPGSETTGQDDTLVPVDYGTAGMMRDDDLRALLVDPLRRTGAALRVALDCCHSGTGMDLKYNLSLASAWDGDLRAVRDAPGGSGQSLGAPATPESQLRGLVSRLTAEAVRSELKVWFGDALVDKHLGPATAAGEQFTEWTADGVQIVLSGGAVEGRSVAATFVASAPDVIAVSGCADRQTSADASFGDRAGGALTHYLLEALQRPVADSASGAAVWPVATDLLRVLRRRLRAGGYDQIPQISSEIPVTASTRFNLL